MTGPRCPERGCPVRYRGGPDRLCPEHQAEAADVAQLAEELGAELAAPKGITGKASPWQADRPGGESR